ncbi:hypothetical protein BDR22DRAFT_825253 [Usnea florida]
MASIVDVSSGIGNLRSPIIIGCTLEVAEKFMFLPTNQPLHLSCLPPLFHSESMNSPGIIGQYSPTDTIYFALPSHPRHPGHGYVFSRLETNADFQLPQEPPKSTSVAEFRISINADQEWTLIDESITGISLNGTRLHSADSRKLLARTGYQLSASFSEMSLLANGQRNSIRFGWSGLHFNLYVLRDPADYLRDYQLTLVVPQSNTHNSISANSSHPLPSLPQSSKYIFDTKMLNKTAAIDAELHRQIGGDLSQGFCIDPASFTETANESDGQDWIVLAGTE